MPKPEEKHSYVTSDGEARKITSVMFPIDVFTQVKNEADEIGLSVSSFVLALVVQYFEHKAEVENGN